MSFTGVVGYQTTSSSICKASPLFTVRSKRALNEESNDIAWNYVGKDKENAISISKRDTEEIAIQKFIDRLIRMDDATYNKFVTNIIIYLIGTYNIKDVGIVEIVHSLEYLKEIPEESKEYLSKINSGLVNGYIPRKDAFIGFGMGIICDLTAYILCDIFIGIMVLVFILLSVIFPDIFYTIMCTFGGCVSYEIC